MARPFDLASMSYSERQFLTKSAEEWGNRLIDHKELEKRITLGKCPSAQWEQKYYDTHLGDFDKYMSWEVLIEILKHLPIKDLVAFSRLNSRAKHIVDRWHPWYGIKNCGLNVIRALLATPARTRWTVPEVECVVFSQHCEICGEHGEIVYLPKLMRCCYCCLSSDRRLLALPLRTCSSSVFRAAELDQVPQFGVIPQESLFGQPVQDSFRILDYTSGLAHMEKRGIDFFERNGAGDLDVMLPPTLFPDWSLPKEMRSRPAKPRMTLQDRRQQKRVLQLPSLKVPSSILDVPENTYQHACSVHQMAAGRSPGRTSYYMLPARYCAGCAHFWNYHSALPFQYHALYHTDSGLEKLDSHLMQHISTCVYARMFWNKLYPISETHPDKVDIARAILILENNWKGTLHFPRFSGESTEECNALFEVLPGMPRYLHHTYKANGRVFQPALKWPVLSKADDDEDDNKATTDEQPEDESPINDVFGDMLFGPEAISQANWACASRKRSSYLFSTPVKLLGEKFRREIRRYKKMRAQGLGYAVPIWRNWGFDRF